MSFPTVGVIGGYPLSTMMISPALALGIDLKATTATDLATICESANGCDVLTFASGRITSGLVRALEAEGIRVQPSATSMGLAQNKTELTNAGIAVWAEGEYFEREIYVLVARSPHDQAAVWAITEAIEEESGCRQTSTPALGLTIESIGQAQRIALETAKLVRLVGVASVRLRLVGAAAAVHEIRLGPSDVGDWTIEGSLTSQYEQHLRAILDLPLGATDLLAPFVVTADLVQTEKKDLYRPYLHVFARDPGVKVHQSGQEGISGQKLGHVTVIGSNVFDLRQRAAHAAEYISGVIDE